MVDQPIDEHLDDEAKEIITNRLGLDSEMGPLIIPPIPTRDIRDYAGETDFTGELYALADLARGFNLVSDPLLAYYEEYDEEQEEWIDYDEPQYNISLELIPQLQIASSIIYYTYYTALKDLAEELGVDDLEEYETVEGYNYTDAVADYFDYEIPTYKPSIRALANELNVEETEIITALTAHFGDDIEQSCKTKTDDEISFTSTDELREKLDLDEE